MICHRVRTRHTSVSVRNSERVHVLNRMLARRFMITSMQAVTTLAMLTADRGVALVVAKDAAKDTVTAPKSFLRAMFSIYHWGKRAVSRVPSGEERCQMRTRVNRFAKKIQPIRRRRTNRCSGDSAPLPLQVAFRLFTLMKGAVSNSRLRKTSQMNRC